MKPVTISKFMIKFWSKFHIQMLWYSFTWDSRFLQTPSLISTRKILPPASLDIKNSLSEGMRDGVMKVQFFRELLKGIFIHQKKKTKKNNKKADLSLKFCMRFFSDICMKCFNPQVRINKMINEHTVDYHLNPSESTSRIHLLIFL